VVSWNVWWRFGTSWRRRQEGIASTLEDLGPDVVGLQEVWAQGDGSQADVLAERLSMHSAFAAPSLPPPPVPAESPDQVGIDVGVAVLSRWPIVDRRTCRLPSAHRVPPVTLLVTLDHPRGPLHVTSACVEWEPAFADDHLAQTRELAALLTDPALDGDLPVLLTADLNAAPDTPQVQALTTTMVDTWIAGHGDHDGVTLSSQNPSAPLDATNQIDRRIDYILTRPGHQGRPVTVDRTFVASRPIDGTPPSDHYAVIADLVA
jgi:endonuclease/exonuclease/phosphatase family metal-dependent hydrolase